MNNIIFYFILIIFYKIYAKSILDVYNQQSNYPIKPRVCFFLGSLGIGGIERAISLIINYFTDKNIFSIILTKKKSKKEFNILPNIKRYYFNFNLEENIDSKAYLPLKYIMINNKINIFFNNCNSQSTSIINKVMHSIRLKVIYMCHSTFIDLSYSYKRTILMTTDYDLFISLLNFNALYMLSNKRKNSLVLPIQINTNKIDKLPDYIPNKNIIMVGRPSRGKNYEFAIEVLYEVVKKIKDARLLLIGLDRKKTQINSKDYLSYIKKKIKILNLERNILLTMPSINISSYYQNSSICLSCSYYEGYHNVISEAKTFGLATIVVGITYVSPAKKGTINIHKYDKKSTISELLKLLTNNTYLQEMRKFAFENRMEFTNDELIDIWIKIFDNLLSYKTKEFTKLKLKLINFNDKNYLELDKMMIREKEDKIIKKLWYNF